MPGTITQQMCEKCCACEHLLCCSTPLPLHASSALTTCPFNPLLPNVTNICDAQCDAQNAEHHLIMAALTRPLLKVRSSANLTPNGQCYKVQNPIFSLRNVASVNVQNKSHDIQFLVLFTSTCIWAVQTLHYQ